MNALNNETVNSSGWPFRGPDMDTESNLEMNQRMIGQLLKRTKTSKGLPSHECRSLIALGIEIAEAREEKAGLSLKEAAKLGGLDPAFLAIVEAGKSLPEEIMSPDVLPSLARCAETSIGELQSAMVVNQSYVVEETPGLLNNAVVLVQALFSLCSPTFMREATAFKTAAGTGSDLASILFDDPDAKVSYRIGGFIEGEPLSLVFYEFQNPDSPLDGWVVSVRTGLTELASGTTSDLGVFRFPDGMDDFPVDAHILIRRSL